MPMPMMMTMPMTMMIKMTIKIVTMTILPEFFCCYSGTESFLFVACCGALMDAYWFGWLPSSRSMIIHPASRPRYEVASLKSGEYLTRLTRLDLTNFQKKNNRVKRSGETPKRTNNKQREIHARATSVFSHAPHRFKSRLKHSQINHIERQKQYNWINKKFFSNLSRCRYVGFCYRWNDDAYQFAVQYHICRSCTRVCPSSRGSEEYIPPARLKQL